MTAVRYKGNDIRWLSNQVKSLLSLERICTNRNGTWIKMTLLARRHTHIHTPQIMLKLWVLIFRGLSGKWKLHVCFMSSTSAHERPWFPNNLLLYLYREKNPKRQRAFGRVRGCGEGTFTGPAVMKQPTLLGSVCISQPRHSSAAKLGRVLMTCRRPNPMAGLINGPLGQGDNTKPASGLLVLCPSIPKTDAFELSSFHLPERYSRRLARNIVPRNEPIESSKRINRTLNDLKGHSRFEDWQSPQQRTSQEEMAGSRHVQPFNIATWHYLLLKSSWRAVQSSYKTTQGWCDGSAEKGSCRHAWVGSLVPHGGRREPVPATFLSVWLLHTECDTQAPAHVHT